MIIQQYNIMKQIFFTTLLFFYSFSLMAQDISGFWYGYPDMKTHRLRLTIQLQKKGEQYMATLQMPDHSSQEYSAQLVSFENKQLTLQFPEADLTCIGNLQEGERFVGSVTQEGYTFDLVLTRKPIVFKRPQTPKAPFPYTSEEIRIPHPEANITLAGTLTLPKNCETSPVVLFLSGSGGQDRDNTFFEHKTFWVLADYLARKGIASLRVDDRGIGQSEGNFQAAGLPDFDADAQVALAYLRHRPEFDSTRVGVIGHSEGAFVAFSLAGRKEVDFIVTMAGGGINGRELLLMQRAALLKASGAQADFIEQYNQYMRQAQDIVLQSADAITCEKRLASLFIGTPLAGQERAITQQLYNPGKIELLKYDPEWDFPEINCPVLALNGDKDCQVPVENLSHIQQGISSNGNTQVTTIIYPGLNHMFQSAQTGLPVEYADIEETIHSKVLEDLTNWLLQFTTK